VIQCVFAKDHFGATEVPHACLQLANQQISKSAN
jgi:hypothetical protein